MDANCQIWRKNVKEEWYIVYWVSNDRIYGGDNSKIATKNLDDSSCEKTLGY